MSEQFQAPTVSANLASAVLPAFFDLPPALTRRLKDCKTLPSMPGAVLEVLKVARDPDASLSDYTHAIERDPALTVRFLSLANSALYRGSKKKVTICQDAVIRLGTDATIAAVLSFSLLGGKQSTTTYTYIWQRAVIATLSIQCLSEHFLCQSQARQLFTAALLQDIGVMALHEIAPPYAEILEIYLRDHEALCAQEKSLFGCDHAAIGAWLLKSMGIPENLAILVAQSHGSNEAIQTSLLCLQLSGSIADAWLSPTPQKCFRELVTHHPALKPKLLANLLDHLQKQLPPIAQLFNFVMPPMLNSEVLLAEAKQLLHERNQQLQLLLKREQEKSIALQEQNTLLDHQSRTDLLTGIANRAYLEKKLALFFEQASTGQDTLSVIFIDLDHFKQLNDNFGHQVGDDVLRQFAKLLSGLAVEKKHSAGKLQDIMVGRYGGEEFLVLLSQQPPQQAEYLADQLSHALLTTTMLEISGQPLKISASIGIASMSDAIFQTPIELIEAADRSMYLAKRSGRGRTILFDGNR
jgi:diguanylate cyclase (GGDEF)-like protein